MAGFAQQVRAQHAGPAAVLVDQGGRIARHLVVLDDAQDLRHRDAAGRWRRHAAHLVLAIGCAYRLALLGLVVGQVAQRGNASGGVAVVGGGDLVDDGLRDRTVLVEGVRAAGGNGGEHIGQRGIPDDGVDRARRAVGIQEVGGHLGVALDVGNGRGARDRGGHAWRDREAVGGQLDGRGEQVLPRGLAMLAVSQFQHAQRAGRTDGAAAAYGVGGGRRLVRRGLPAQVVLVGARGGHLAAVIGRDLFRRGVVIHDEGAAADAG
ncbi:hypothetical protein D9M72_375250 [compost metagenome]